jgi:hypothetical protein
MIEHRLDTKVFQAYLATAWQEGYFAGRDDEAVGAEWRDEPNPYWEYSGSPADLDVVLIAVYEDIRQLTPTVVRHEIGDSE